MTAKNAIYAQSGGVTAVINATACAVVQTAKKHKSAINKVFGAKNGIVGILREELYDTSRESARDIENLKYRPGGVFGSCRFKLGEVGVDDRISRRLFDVFKAHNVGYFFYNGGGDSQDTANKVTLLGRAFNYPMRCIGIPKTVDNDLARTDSCPGFGSVAKYVATSVKEAALDVQSMCDTSTKVFILEVMGRHAGWIAAAGGLAKFSRDDPPHIILFPEIAFQRDKFLAKVQSTVEATGYCVVVASEGVRDEEGQFLAESGGKDAFGHVQLGGVGATLASMVSESLGYKFHFAIADYLQRSARHIASKTDLDHAYSVGAEAVKRAVQGQTGIMVIIKRVSDDPYEWTVGTTPIGNVANVERKVPRRYITKSGFGITAPARRYLQPLVQGEAYPRYRDGLPNYVALKNIEVEKKLLAFEP